LDHQKSEKLAKQHDLFVVKFDAERQTIIKNFQEQLKLKDVEIGNLNKQISNLENENSKIQKELNEFKALTVSELNAIRDGKKEKRKKRKRKKKKIIK